MKLESLSVYTFLKYAQFVLTGRKLSHLFHMRDIQTSTCAQGMQ